MIFWIFVILTVAGVIWTYANVLYEELGIILAVLAGSTAIIMLIFIVLNNVGAEGTRQKLEEQHKALVYKAQTEACRDEFGIVNKSFIDEVQEWNMDCVKYKNWQRDFWIGIFIPDIFDEFETINLEDIAY